MAVEKERRQGRKELIREGGGNKEGGEGEGGFAALLYCLPDI